jgi:H+/Cl- antiporter ClcA
VRRVALDLVLAALFALPIGAACAIFLVSLDFVTDTRVAHPSLLATLPLLGMLIAVVYRSLGGHAVRGTNLILDEIHEPRLGVPLRMAPLVLIGTLLTHLGGGSAGREGTAVQLGGVVAGGVGRRLKLRPDTIRTLLISGMAAGFGGVFGTPIAGAMFACEVLVRRRVAWKLLPATLIASVLADRVVHASHVHHTAYVVSAAPLRASTLAVTLLAAVAFALAAWLFMACTKRIEHVLAVALRRRDWLYPLAGGVLVLSLAAIVGHTEYLGLGVKPQRPGGVSIVTSFSDAPLPPWAWLMKLVSTALTIGSGFKGGEVTPLFFIGSTLGHTIGSLAHAPIDLFAACGLAATFAAASRTPLASTILAMELFGTHNAIYYAIACVLAGLVSPGVGLYSSQRTPEPMRPRSAHAGPGGSPSGSAGFGVE